MAKIALAPIAHTNKRTSYLFAGFGVGVVVAWIVSAWRGWIPSNSALLVLWMSAVVAAGAFGLICAGFAMDAQFVRVDDETP